MAKITDGSLLLPLIISDHMRISAGYHIERTSRSHCQHCILTIKINQISSAFHFPWFWLFPSFISLPSQDQPLCASLPLLLTLFPFLHRWGGHGLFPSPHHLGFLLDFFPFFAHAHVLSQLFLSALPREWFCSSFGVGRLPSAGGRLLLPPLPFPCSVWVTGTEQAAVKLVEGLQRFSNPNETYKINGTKSTELIQQKQIIWFWLIWFPTTWSYPSHFIFKRYISKGTQRYTSN